MIYVYDDGPGRTFLEAIDTALSGNRFKAYDRTRKNGTQIAPFLLAVGRSAEQARDRAAVILARREPVLTYDESEQE